MPESVEIYLRPLQKEDSLISCNWRNDPIVWKYTFSRPDRFITPEIEQKWIEGVLADSTRKTFAICTKGTNEYVGNVQLTDFDGKKAEFSIFIGNRAYWGCGIATQATKLILEYAWNELSLESVFLHVKAPNLAARKVYENNGFHFVVQDGEDISMICLNPNSISTVRKQ